MKKVYLQQKSDMDEQMQPIEPFEVARLAHIDRDSLKARLKIFILDLLQHDFEHLCNLMYRHDVKESLFNEALMLANDSLRAEVIADLVIDRELQKVASRAAYAQSKQNKPLSD